MQLVQRTAQRHSIVMTGNMQQAIALLQLSNSDLCSYIEKEAEENPFIDVERSLRPAPALPYSGGGQNEGDDPVSRLAAHPMSLYGHVSAQFDIMFPEAGDRMIADRFLQALDQNGWLCEPLEKIASDCGLSSEAAENILQTVQQVEPAGLFARNLAECLRLQADDQGLLSDVFGVVLNNLPRLAAADLSGLARLANCTMEDLRTTLKQLRSLNPKPGSDFNVPDMSEREPDLIVSRGARGWQVELNKSTLPSVAISEIAKSPPHADSVAQEYISQRLGVARWLRRAVEHRNQTTLSVGAEIVRRQTAFLDHGPARITPMTLADVAQAVGVHESTVSRVTTGVMITTPQGTFSLKRFFSTALSGPAGADGNTASAAAIRYKVEKLVAGEDPANPLSDDAIARTINADGAILARRTIAKYRDMLNIPSSFQRKRQAKLRSA